MAENPENSSSVPNNPLSSIISKFTDVFNNFRFPPPPVVVKSDAAVKVTADVADDKPVSVRYPPDASSVDVAPVKVESGEVDHVTTTTTTNPALMWQVLFNSHVPSKLFIF